MLYDAAQTSSWRLQEIFAKLDSNNEGAISRADFRHGLQEFGFDASPADLDAAFDDISDGEGRIQYRNVLSLLRQRSKIIPGAVQDSPTILPNGKPIEPMGASPIGKPLMTLPPSQRTCCDPFNKSSTQSRDRRRGHAVAIHFERMDESRMQSPNDRPTAGMR